MFVFPLNLFEMTRTQYFFSFVLATISFIAARSIQREGIENYYKQLTSSTLAEQGFIDFENPSAPSYLPMGLQPFSALTTLDSLQTFAISQDSLQILRYDAMDNTFMPFKSDALKMTQLTGYDSTLVFLDTEQQLHFLNMPDFGTKEVVYALKKEDDSRLLLGYHSDLKRLLLLHTRLIDNGLRLFECQTFNIEKQHLSQVPLFSFESAVLLFEPISMAIHPYTNEFYLLSNTGEVAVLDQNGTLLSRQQLPNTISAPSVINFAANGDLLATDANVLHPVMVRLPWLKTSTEQGPLVH